MPIALRGDTSVASMALALVGRQGIDARQSKVIEAMYRNTALSQAMNEGFAVRDQVQRTVQAEMDAASRNAIGTKGFALVARRVARLMRYRFDLDFFEVGGWGAQSPDFTPTLRASAFCLRRNLWFSGGLRCCGACP